MELTDEEITVLDDLIIEQRDRNRQYPGEMSDDDQLALDELSAKVRRLAKERKLWWTQ